MAANSYRCYMAWRGWTTATRLSPEFATQPLRGCLRKLQAEAYNPLSFTLSDSQGQ
ncbi:MAG: hypothetical protein LBG45_04790 [Dysgonamonadaceae bacterium]|nr:hypothetical protein [Dysgonamonadaceae bacterium]